MEVARASSPTAVACAAASTCDDPWVGQRHPQRGRSLEGRRAALTLFTAF